MMKGGKKLWLMEGRLNVPMKTKAKVVWKNENHSEVRGQKCRKSKFQIHQVTLYMYDLEQVIILSEVQFLIYKMKLIRTA